MNLHGYKVDLEVVSSSHLEMLRTWRNDPSISQYMLSQEIITEAQQKAWFERIIKDDTQQHWIINFRDRAIGSANIKTLDGLSLGTSAVVEPGLYIADSNLRGNIVAFSPSLLLLDYCFDTLGVKHIKAHVKSSNQAALNYNKQLGYKIVNQGDLVEIQLDYEDYRHATKQIRALLSR